MPMNRAQKQEAIEMYRERFDQDEIMVVVHNNGLTVAQMTQLRGQIRQEGANIKVMKNTLAKLALKGTKFEHASDMFAGPTIIATSNEPGVAKIIQKFAKANKKLTIVGGAMGAIQLDAAGVEQLSKLPSLDELRSKLIGLIQAPATKIAGVVQAPATKMARVVKAYAEKG